MRTSKNGRDEEHMPVVAALVPVLYNLPPKIIVIDGRPGSGKTTLGRFLAWWFNVSLIETDHFLFGGEGLYRYRTDEIKRIIRVRLDGHLPVIVEGVTVLRQLTTMNLAPDFLIYVENAGAPTLRREYEAQLADYQAEFEPRRRAGFMLALDH